MGQDVTLSRTGRPRVVHVTTAHLADDVRIFERECRSLAASGRYDVFLAAAGQIPADSGVTPIPLRPAPASRAGRFSSGPRKVSGLSRALAADLWHFHDPELLPVALKLALSGHRVIWDAHEDYVAQFTEKGGKNWVPGSARSIVRSGTAGLLAVMDRHAAGVIAATSTIAGRYKNPRTVVVGNEAKLERFADCAPTFEARRILFTGSPGPGHLFGEVVEAVAQVPAISLAVAGRKPDPLVWARALGVLGDRLTHVGWLDRTGLAREMSSSSLGLATYAPVPTYMTADGSPTKVYEFAAAGLPVIGVPIPALRQLGGPAGTGFVAQGFTPDDLRAAIESALSDPGDWQRISRQARAWAAEAGSWTDSEARLLDLYGEVFADVGGGSRSSGMGADAPRGIM